MMSARAQRRAWGRARRALSDEGDDVTVPAGEVTVLCGTREQRRRLFALLLHAPARARGEQVVRHVTVSASSTAADREALLGRLVEAPADVLLVDNVTGGLGARARRSLLGLLRRLADAGTAVVVDDRDPLAAMAVADHSLSFDADGVPALRTLAVWPLPEPAGPSVTPPSRMT